MPFEGTIDWPAALTAMQKVGYDGPLMFEIAAHGSAERDAGGAQKARQRMERLLQTKCNANRTIMHVYIEDIGRHEGEEVTIKGWLHNRRSSGKIHFLILRDGTGFIQAVMSKAAVGDDLFKAADHLSQETSVIVTGTARADKRAPSGYEIDVKSLEVVGESHDYPITPKEHGVDYLLDRRHLWIRSERQQAILRVRHEIINAVRDFFNSRGFILADTPIFTPAACEGTTTLFPAQYFEDQTAYLTQSGQLYNEANAMALGRVYCFGPTFRAEKSKTRRHLTEFWMVEPEMAYADLDDVMDLAEDLVVSVVARVLDKRRRELTVIERDVIEARSGPEAVSADHLRRRGEDAAGQGAADSVGRRFRRPRRDDAVGTVRPAGDGAPLPAAIKAFYMKPDPERADLALGVDVLAPEGYGEIIGGGERLADLRSAAPADQGTQPAAGSVRVVSRSPPLRHRAARRLRHGHRARRRVDLQARTRARDDSVSAHAVPAVSVNEAGDWGPRRLQRGYDVPRSPSAPVSPGCHENRSHLSRLSEKPRRLRGDARARAAGGSRAHAGRRRTPTCSS